jgi:hypothetical protein
MTHTANPRTFQTSLLVSHLHLPLNSSGGNAAALSAGSKGNALNSWVLCSHVRQHPCYCYCFPWSLNDDRIRFKHGIVCMRETMKVDRCKGAKRGSWTLHFKPRTAFRIEDARNTRCIPASRFVAFLSSRNQFREEQSNTH